MLTEEPVRAPKLVQLGIEENIPISDSVSMVKGVYFELTDPVDIPGLKENGNDIELHFDTIEKNKLMAFVIWVSGSDLQDNTVAYEKAYRLTNLLTLKTGKFVFHKRPREFVNDTIGQVLKSIGQTCIKNSLVNLIISDSAIQSLLDNDSLLNQQLAHFCNGIKAFDELNFSEAVKEFHQFRIICVENPSSTSTPKMKYVDISDPEVQAIVEREAKYLRTEAFKHIDPKVGIRTD